MRFYFLFFLCVCMCVVHIRMKITTNFSGLFFLLENAGNIQNRFSLCSFFIIFINFLDEQANFRASLI